MSTIGHKLNKLRSEEPESCDVHLVSKTGQAIACHRCVLQASCPYFRCMLGGGFRESKENRIKIDASHDVLDLLINHVYTGDDPVGVHGDNLLEFYSWAIRLELQPLEDFCSKYTLNMLGRDNVIAVVNFAVQHDLERLRHACILFLRENFRAVFLAEDSLEIPRDVRNEVVSPPAFRMLHRDTLLELARRSGSKGQNFDSSTANHHLHVVLQGSMEKAVVEILCFNGVDWQKVQTTKIASTVAGGRVDDGLKIVRSCIVKFADSHRGEFFALCADGSIQQHKEIMDSFSKATLSTRSPVVDFLPTKDKFYFITHSDGGGKSLEVFNNLHRFWEKSVPLDEASHRILDAGSNGVLVLHRDGSMRRGGEIIESSEVFEDCEAVLDPSGDCIVDGLSNGTFHTYRIDLATHERTLCTTRPATAGQVSSKLHCQDGCLYLLGISNDKLTVDRLTGASWVKLTELALQDRNFVGTEDSGFCFMKRFPRGTL